MASRARVNDAYESDDDVPLRVMKKRRLFCLCENQAVSLLAVARVAAPPVPQAPVAIVHINRTVARIGSILEEYGYLHRDYWKVLAYKGKSQLRVIQLVTDDYSKMVDHCGSSSSIFMRLPIQTTAVEKTVSIKDDGSMSIGKGTYNTTTHRVVGHCTDGRRYGSSFSFSKD
jgi:hypothetical protein